ncbi:MAG: hypothetical protein ACLVJO_09365 [[Clostridium] scindens]
MEPIRRSYQAKKKRPGLQICGKVAYVAGDRRRKHLPAGSIKDNMIVSKIMILLLAHIHGNVDQAVTHWNQRLRQNARLPIDLITMLSRAASRRC